MRETFLVVHGLTGSGPEHWQTWLAGELAARGEMVRYPSFSDADEPALDVWLSELAGELAACGAGSVTVLAHSLGCHLWLHHADRGGRAAERVLLVAPPAPSFEHLPELREFPPGPLDAAAIARAARRTELVFAHDDPWWPGGAGAAFEALGVPTHEVAGGAHLNTDAGYGPWPWVLEWALARSD